MGNVFGVFAKGIAMFDVFGLMDDNSAKDKKKKTKTL